MKKQIIKNIFKFVNVIGRGKIFVQRAMGYVALINTGMLMLLVLERFGFKILENTLVYASIYLGTFTLLILIGFIDDKIGMFRVETTISADRNPYFKTMLEKLDNLEKEIKELKK